MRRPKSLLVWTICLGIQLASCAELKTPDGVQAVERRAGGDAMNDDANFFAARGRRSDKASGGQDDFFWANRGKKWDGDDKRRRSQSFNIPRPNGFFFPSTIGKRDGFNIPKPNGFFFPMGKRTEGFNLPRPNGFMFLSKQGKRFYQAPDAQAVESPEESLLDHYLHGFNIPKPTGFFWPGYAKRAQSMWNLSKPNGFFFPFTPLVRSPPKRGGDLSWWDGVEAKRDFLEAGGQRAGDASGREAVDSFFAGRGKKDAADPMDTAGFFAGRGKKAPNAGDVFFAGRG